MRKIIAFLFIPVVMLFHCQSSNAEAIQIECKLVNAVNWSADEWFETAENRALLTMLFVYEMGANNTIAIDEYSVSDSLVCKNESLLSVAICGNKDSIMIFYTPDLPYAKFLPMEKYTIDTIQNTLELIYPEVKLNSKEALQQALDLIGTMLSN